MRWECIACVMAASLQEPSLGEAGPRSSAVLPITPSFLFLHFSRWPAKFRDSVMFSSSPSSVLRRAARGAPWGLPGRTEALLFRELSSLHGEAREHGVSGPPGAHWDQGQDVSVLGVFAQAKGAVWVGKW